VHTEIVQEYPEDPTRYCNETKMQGEKEFLDEAQSRDYVKKLYNRKSLVLLIKATSEDLSNAYKDGKMSCCRST
jgi:hypothetical protein